MLPDCELSRWPTGHGSGGGQETPSGTKGMSLLAQQAAPASAKLCGPLVKAPRGAPTARWGPHMQRVRGGGALRDGDPSL